MSLYKTRLKGAISLTIGSPIEGGCLVTGAEKYVILSDVQFSVDLEGYTNSATAGAILVGCAFTLDPNETEAAILLTESCANKAAATAFDIQEFGKNESALYIDKQLKGDVKAYLKALDSSLPCYNYELHWTEECDYITIKTDKQSKPEGNNPYKANDTAPWTPEIS